MVGRVFALFVSCLLVQVLSQKPPADPRVGCPSGYQNPNSWFLNYATNQRWGGLCPAYNKCSTGFMQSPISINPALTSNGRRHEKLRLSLGNLNVNFLRLQDLLIMPGSGTNTLKWKEQLYNLDRVEFHSPSEHSFAGRYATLEVQLYFNYNGPIATDKRGTQKAAIAVLFNCGAQCDDPFFASVLPAMPNKYWQCACGNNRTEPYNPYLTYPEECDEGEAQNSLNAPNRCRRNCKLPSCGDNVTDPLFKEECDTGANATVANNCRANCRLPYCGDGVVDTQLGEVCDTGAWWEGSGCTGTCQLECGDGCLQPNEDCDYGSPALFPNRMNNNTNATARSTCRLNCLWARCGDGILDFPEECDEGIYGLANNTGSRSLNRTHGALIPNGCRPNCTLPRCGDGVLDFSRSNVNHTGTPNGGEQCEPSINGNICLGNCAWACGDGNIDPTIGETCDNGTLNSDLPWVNGTLRPCRTWRLLASGFPVENRACQLARCGDGIVDPALSEECDDFGRDTFYCFANCTLRCGNRYIDGPFNRTYGTVTESFPGEVCDNGNDMIHNGVSPRTNRTLDGNSDTRPNGCRTDCAPCVCGDGVVDPVGCEQCDNGNVALWGPGARFPTRGQAAAGLRINMTLFAGVANSDTRPNACRTNCRFAYCGDGVRDDGEECDDGNTIDDDGCSCCKRDCGNGIKQGTEECDDGVANSNTTGDRCRLNCKVHTCGDNQVDSDEECDVGPVGNELCTSSCTRTFCGDGVRQRSLQEECDNGAANSYTDISETGCSPVCTRNICGRSMSGNVVNLQTLLPSVIGAHAYVGSETKPPCGEAVQWFVLPAAKLLSPAQCAAFRFVVNRPSNRCGQGFFGRRAQVAPTSGYGNTPFDRRAVSNCGDGIVQVGEECDNGRMNSDNTPDACSTRCRAPKCGNGIVDSGEECDGQSFCLPICKVDRRTQRAARHVDALWSSANSNVWTAWGTCAGNQQSPIRLPQACPAARALNLNHPSNIQYNPTPVVMFNTGSNILFPVLAGGTFNYKGVSYTLSKVEFHEPSEHYIGTQRFPFEVQLFHTSNAPGSNAMAVLSILFTQGTNCNSVLQPILDRLPRVSHCQCGNGIKEDIQTFHDGSWVKEECDDGAMNNDRLPNRCRSNCRMAYCGDGVIDSKEQCDQGAWNGNVPNRCRSTCVTPYCGDGIVDNLLGETCDDGNNINGDKCNANCQLECGDGVKGQNEQCDDGVYNSDQECDGCRTDCTTKRCGDGALDSGELCDEGSRNSDTAPNTCRLDCSLPRCGDKVVDAGEQCDGSVGCTAQCTLLCGNGVVDNTTGYLEQCDNGAANSNTVPNACRANCKSPTCGDGTRDDGEACDRGADDRWCRGCQVVCGNGILDVGEECDDGIFNSDSVPNACRTNCMLWNCGDGVLDALEECDTGVNNRNTSDACRPWCRIPQCGDGIVDVARGETCDDGNEMDGDGCDCTCHVECGNGRVDPGEVCDTGASNSDTLPGCCRRRCVLPRCGDGVTDAGEECDDGADNRNAPNSCRPDCTLPKCGDGFVDHLYGEYCDQGSRNSLTQIDGCSPACTHNLCRQSVHLNVSVNFASLLPTAPGTYHYAGSRNSPPCEETAQWFVFSNPAPICGCQLDQFRKVLSGNARCLQARNGRAVNFLEVTAKCGDGMVEGNEECDAGPMNSDFAPNACRRNCRLPRCGDGVQDKGEQCDGTPNCSQTCTFNCPGAAAGGQGNQATGNAVNIDFANIIASP